MFRNFSKKIASEILVECAVPNCGNNSLQFPDKWYLPAPEEKSLRAIWFQFAKLDLPTKPSKNIYFCEDHFDPNNYLHPTRFACQVTNETESDIRYIKRRGGTILLNGGRQYYKHTTYKNKAVVWVCANKRTNCKGTLTINEESISKSVSHSCQQNFTKNEIDLIKHEEIKKIFESSDPPITAPYEEKITDLQDKGTPERFSDISLIPLPPAATDPEAPNTSNTPLEQKKEESNLGLVPNSKLKRKANERHSESAVHDAEIGPGDTGPESNVRNLPKRRVVIVNLTETPSNEIPHKKTKTCYNDNTPKIKSLLNSDVKAASNDINAELKTIQSKLKHNMTHAITNKIMSDFKVFVAPKTETQSKQTSKYVAKVLGSRSKVETINACNTEIDVNGSSFKIIEINSLNLTLNPIVNIRVKDGVPVLLKMKRFADQQYEEADKLVKLYLNDPTKLTAVVVHDYALTLKAYRRLKIGFNSIMRRVIYQGYWSRDDAIILYLKLRTVVKLNNYLHTEKIRALEKAVEQRKTPRKRDYDDLEIFTCEFCYIEFKAFNDLNTHFSEKHYLDKNFLDVTSDIFQCGKCPASFLTDLEMLNHLKCMHGDLLKQYLFKSNLNLDSPNSQTEKFIKSSTNASCVEMCGNSFKVSAIASIATDDSNIETKEMIEETNKCKKLEKSVLMNEFLENFTQTNPIHVNEKYQNCNDLNNANEEKCNEIIDQHSEYVDNMNDENHIENNTGIEGFTLTQPIDVDHAINMETTVEIKRETEEPFEDVDDNLKNLISNELEINDLDEHIGDTSELNAGHLQIKEVFGSHDFPINFEADFISYDSIPKDEYDSDATYCDDTFKCSYCDMELPSENDLAIHVQDKHHVDSPPSSPIQCKTCRITFTSHEKLLDHIHEHFNNKLRASPLCPRKIYLTPHPSTDRNDISKEACHATPNSSGKNDCLKKVLRVDLSKDQEIINEYLSKIDKRQTEKSGTDGVEENRKTLKPKLFNTRRRRRSKKPCAQMRNDTSRTINEAEEISQKVFTDKELLQNMQKVYNKLKKTTEIAPDICKTPTVDVNMVSTEIDTLTEDNDLLQPIREEDERVLVEAFDPTVCRSCRKPLLESEMGNDQNCVKCKSILLQNNKKPLSKMKTDNSGGGIKKQLRQKFMCNICALTFLTKLKLREHVGESHM